MDFRDKDGAPLIKWTTPEEAFEGWKECSRGRPCDYTGLSYAKLTGGSGISWPCNEKYPDGTPHLYTDFVFNTDVDYCETYGQDFETGAATTPEEYRAHNPAGRALIKPAEYRPPDEAPDEEYPLWYTYVPFHYGHWDNPESRPRAANELTITGWDPVSKEPYFKYTAVRIRKVDHAPSASQGYTVQEFVDKSDGAIKTMVESASATTLQEV